VEAELRAICARLPGNELVGAECANLTGGLPDADGVAVCQTLAHIHRAAYVRTGLRCLAQAPALEALAEQVAELSLDAERFSVDFLNLSPHPASKSRVILRLANALPARPDLEAPRHRFLAVAQAERWWFGEILAESTRSYEAQDAKPYRTSASLPSRLARALVNLVVPPARTLLDPFCGTGSLLLEAQAVGAQAFGVDWNPKMAGMSKRNLLHFGCPAQVEHLDALRCERPADAIVTDLPYGRLLEDLDWRSLPLLLAHLGTLAPRAVYLAEQDLSHWLAEAGYAPPQVLRVRKRPGLTRFVHIAHRSHSS
jgi:predicted RNA methylase